MPQSSSAGLAVVFAALVGVAVTSHEGVATAQQGGSAGSSGSHPGSNSPSSDVKSASLTPQQEVTQGTAMVQEMQQGRDSVQVNLQQAHETKDPIKINAYSDILNQLDVLVKSANERLKSLGAAAQVGDVDLANHEFQIIITLHDNAKALIAQSKSVVGNEISTLDAGNISVTIDIALPGPGATDPLSFLPNIIIIPVTNASVIQ